MENFESNSKDLKRKQSKGLKLKSKITIQVELPCNSDELTAKLNDLIIAVEGAKNETNDYFGNTLVILENLLVEAKDKVTGKPRSQQGTIQNDNTAWEDVECLITLSTVPLPPPHIIEKD
jgi:hypothetical protein